MVFHGKPKQQAASDLSEDDLYCMVQNVYHEARGEDALGQAAVAQVTLNRVRSPAYPDTVCGVVWQKGQCSWTEDGGSDRMTDLGAIGKAVDIALAAARGRIKDPTGGALHYYAHDRVKPYWSKAGYRLISVTGREPQDEQRRRRIPGWAFHPVKFQTDPLPGRSHPWPNLSALSGHGV
jgi:spore germination cell wall hydrolase CwlJ-like protein